jgi:hypothetical protein
VIVNQIRSSPSVFQLSPSDVASLHNQGVSDRVIVEMQGTCRRPVVVDRRPVYVVEPCPPPPPVIGIGVYRRGCWH